MRLPGVGVEQMFGKTRVVTESPPQAQAQARAQHSSTSTRPAQVRGKYRCKCRCMVPDPALGVPMHMATTRETQLLPDVYQISPY